jgi:hypothetical protein
MNSQVVEGSVLLQTHQYDIEEPVSWFSAQKGRLRLLPTFPECDSLPPACLPHHIAAIHVPPESPQSAFE